MTTTEITENDIYAFFNRDDVTEQEWLAAEAFIAEGRSKAWADYIERRENFDDAIYSDRFRRLSIAVNNRGVETEWVLVKDGEIVPARIVEGQYGLVWCVKTGWEFDADVVEWVNLSVASTIEKKRAHYAKKGYELRLAEFKTRYGKNGFFPILSTATLVEEN